MTRQITLRLAQLATVWALFVLARSLVVHHPDGATAAETEYLAFLVAAVLLGLALSARTAPAIVGGGALIGIALCLPAAQGTRATLVVALLAATLAWCTWQAFAGPRNQGPLEAGSWPEVGGVAIGWQALMRSDRMLDLSLDSAATVWLVALPLVAAAAAVWLARDRGGVATLPLLAALFVLLPGLGIVPVAVLVVVAALGVGPGVSRASSAVAIGACTLALWRAPEVAPALLFLVAALAFYPFARWRWLTPAAVLVWATAHLLLTESVEPAATAVGWILLGLPLALLGGPGRRPLALTGLALTVVAAAGDPVTLAPGVALLAFAVPTEGGVGRLQGVWSLTLLTAVAMAAAYPWLRQPLVDPPTRVLAVPVLALAVLVLASAAIAAWGHRRRGSLGLTWAGVPALVVVLALIAWLTPRAWGREPIVLNADSERWQTTVEVERVRVVTIDSFLSQGGLLAARQPVARVRLVAMNGEVREMTLLHGNHTADWAARRLGRDEAPKPWLSWIAPDGSLAQRYRAVWALESPFRARRLEIALLDNLPAEVELALLRVALR